MGSVGLGPRHVLSSVVFAIAVSTACSHGRPSSSNPGTVTLAIAGATIVHPDGSSAADQTILIEGDRIARVGASRAVRIPAGVRTVVARGKWIIPGLIDSHVHFFQSGTPFTRPDMRDLTAIVPYAEELARTKARLPATLKVWLANGVVAVADAGGPMWNFQVRAVARRSPLAPYVKVAGPLISTVERKELELDDPPIIKVSTPDEARALVRRELERRPDYVKLWFVHEPGLALALGERLARAVADEAHRAGVPFLVHATELSVAKAALRAGADVLVHSVTDAPVDDELIALAKARSAIYIPTLWVFRAPAEMFGGRFEPTAVERARADPETLRAIERAFPPAAGHVRRSTPTEMMNVKKVWNAGITVAMGTDAGNPGVLHGPAVFRELELMAAAGLTPAQVLQSATLNGARMLRMEADLGDIAPGKFAEMVLLDADPLVDVKNLSRIHRVIHRGQLIDPDELLRSLPDR